MPDRKHTLLSASMCQALSQVAVTVSSAFPLHTWGIGRRTHPYLEQERQALSQVSDREASTVGALWLPQLARERAAKACSRHSLSFLPRAQAKKAWGGWSHHPAGSPFLTPPHCVGWEEVVELPFPCALRLPICFLG